MPFFLGFDENPYPGIEGHITSKQMPLMPLFKTGIIFKNSCTLPGHPWVIIIGIAFESFDLLCKK